MHIRHYHPQDHIIRRSEQSSAMFYVLRGTVKVVSHDNEATYYEIKENNFFGDVGVLYRVPRSMDVLAKNRCTIAILSGDDLVKVMEQAPEMAKAIGYQTQERYQMYLKRRQSISMRRTLDGGTGGPDQCQDDAKSDSFAKSDIHSAIRKVPLFQSCSSEVIHMLSLNVEPRTYNIGQSIIRRGEIGREMFFIVSGVVEILSDDNLRVLARFHDGQFFGEIAVLLDVPRIANVKAVSEVEVFVLTKENLEAVFEAVPGAADTITAEGNRLYRNWLIRNSQISPDQPMQEVGAAPPCEAKTGELNHQSLNLPRGFVAPSTQETPIPMSVGVEADMGTDHPHIVRRLSQDMVHPIEAGHPASISVLPMTATAGDFRMTHRPSDVGPIDGNFMQEQDTESNAPLSFFNQEEDTSADAKEGAMEPPTSRNPTIRGLQESNPKRRRASVAVWTQQDLMKLAESAQSKTTVNTTHAPSTSSAMATSLGQVSQQDEDTGRKTRERRSSSVLMAGKAALRQRTGPATFQHLEESSVVQILNALPLSHLLKARRVCKGWNKLIMEHQDVLCDLDFSAYKKIVTDAVLGDVCKSILAHNRARTTRVSLRDCFLVSDKGLTLLAEHMPGVQELDLHSCWNVTDAGFRALGQHCGQLRSIDFSNCRKLGDETIFALYPKDAAVIAKGGSVHLVEAVLGPQAELHPQLEDMIETEDSTDTSMDEAQVLMARRPSINTEAALDEQENVDRKESLSPLVPDMDSRSVSTGMATTTTSAGTGATKTGKSMGQSDRASGGTGSVAQGCPLLSRLNLSYCKNLTDKSFIHLCLYGSKQLESLNLQRCTTITPEAFMSLDIDNKMLVQEQEQETMVYFDGTEPQEVHPGYNPLVEPCFPRLKELVLSDCTFLTDAAIVALAPNMPRLEVVSLSFCCALTDIAVEALSESCLFIKRLDLSFCGSAVSDASLYQLARFDALAPGQHSLEELEIRGCVRVTELGVREIVNGCLHLRRLNISSCSGIGTGELNQQQPQQQPQQQQGGDVSMVSAQDAVAPQLDESQAQVVPTDDQALQQQQQQQDDAMDDGSRGSLVDLPNSAQNGEVARKMSALKRGKEWALAQQRPGLQIIV
ncbi:hypothetical protein BGZ67_004837 [Mortierella alpina]|nr:hypothetical protein BGZ67_004837 [Mortierella alpina]